MGDSTPLSQEAMAALFTRHRTRIAAYAYAILRDYHAVDDVLQDVVMVLIRKRAEFDPARPFLPWALTITRLQALGHHRAHKRTVALDPGLLDRIEGALVADGSADDQERQMAALAGCLETVGEPGARLLRLKYLDHLSADAIAQRTRSTRQAVYSSLQRLRDRLASCIQRRLATEGAT